MPFKWYTVLQMPGSKNVTGQGSQLVCYLSRMIGHPLIRFYTKKNRYMPVAFGGVGSRKGRGPT